MRQFSIMAFCFLVGPILQATIAEARQWQDSTGMFNVEAELVEVQNDVVVLKRSDNGKMLSVPRSRLSLVDQQYLDSLNDSPKAPANEPAPEPMNDLPAESVINPEMGSTAIELGVEPNAPVLTVETPARDEPPAMEPISPEQINVVPTSDVQPTPTETPLTETVVDESTGKIPPVAAPKELSKWDWLRNLMVGSTPTGMAVQYAFLLSAALAHIYQILHMRRSTVVLFSHARLITNVFIISALNLVFYHLVMWLAPSDSKAMLILYFVGFVFALAFWRVIVQGIGGVIDQSRTLKDTAAKEGQLFNCNWPLIPRCCMQSLNYLVLMGLVIKGVV